MISRSIWEKAIAKKPVDESKDYNDIIDQMIQDKIDFEQLENDLFEREEGIEL